MKSTAKFIRWMICTMATFLAFAQVAPAQSSVTFRYFYDSLNQLSRVVDSAGNVITYAYDDAGNLVSVARTTIDKLGPPVLATATPNKVNQGDTAPVVLGGTGLLGSSVTSGRSGVTVVQASGNDTRLTVLLSVAADAPLGSAPLTVTTPIGSASISIDVVGPRPRIQSVVPAEGPIIGRTSISIVGQYFTANTTVAIGGIPATNIRFVDAQHLTAVTPPSPGDREGQVDVTVSNDLGADTLSNGFSYQPGLKFGEVISDSIQRGQQDVFAFQATAGALIRLTAAVTGGPGFSNVCMELFDPDYKSLKSACTSGGGSIQFNETLVGTGTYMIVASEAGNDQTVNYNFSLERFGLNPTPVQFGNVTTDKIEPSTDQDFFSFQATAGALIRLTAAVTGGPAFSNVCMELFDPDYKPLKSACTSGGGSIQFNETLVGTGTYTIVASEAGNDQTVNYNFSLERFGLNPTPVQFGSVTTDKIEPSTDQDFFSFQATAGALIRLTAAVTGGPAFSNVCMELFDPDYKSLKSACTSGGGSIQFNETLVGTGTYTIVASEAGNDQTVNYNFSLERFGLNPTPVQFGNGTTDKIEPSTDQDFFSFQATAGALIRLTAAVTGGPAFSNVCMELFDPDYKSLKSACTSGGGSIQFNETLVGTGTYTIVASEAGNDQTVNYNFSLERFGLNPTPVQFGNGTTDKIEPSTDQDFFSFQATAGALIRLTAAVTGGPAFSNACMELFDPDYKPLKSACTSGGGSIQFNETLVGTGTYTIVASEAGNDQTVNYNFSLERFGLNPTPVQFGNVTTDKIEPSTDQDFFSFQATAGALIRLTAAVTGGPAFSNVCMELFDPDYKPLKSACTSGGGSIQFNETLVGTGTYTIVVSEAGNDQTVNYNFSLERFGLNPTPVQFGNGTTDKIEPSTDQDFFSFQATAGALIRLTAAVTGGPAFSNVCMELFDPDYKSLKSACTSGGGSIQFNETLTRAGTYMIVVSEAGNDQTVNYTLSLTGP